MRPFDGRRVLLVVSGGIAAYKTPHLVRRLQSGGATVEVVLTESASRFVGRATFEGLTGHSAHTDLWERPLDHVELGRDADVVVVAPATADLLARMAGGRADDLAAATLLAADAPIVACPAMNRRMWTHAATVRNVARLREAGVRLVGPEEGELAEGEVGPGRMSEPDAILAEVGRVLEASSPLGSRRVAVTAGPTLAPIDPVRYLSNRSSGRMGYALAASAWRRGAETVLLTGPARVPAPHGPRTVHVEEAGEMLDVLADELERADVLLMAAAVADLRPSELREEKIGKADAPFELALETGPDLLKETREIREERGISTLGFALETGDGTERARAKMEAKGMDWVAVNEAGRAGVGPGAADNRVSLIGRDGERLDIPVLPKAEVADRILDHIEERLDA